MKPVVYIFMALRSAKNILISPIVYTVLTRVLFMLNGVVCGSGLRVRGLMKVHVTRRGDVRIGRNFRVNSGPNYNVIGRQQKTTLWAEGNLTIKDNVSMSSAAIICNHEITVGSNVFIGGNTVIYDTNFHSLNPSQRVNPELDRASTRWAPVSIGNNVFIGAHSTILKGVTIGENSVIGACSVVTRNVPPSEIWAGNPAVFIRRVPLGE